MLSSKQMPRHTLIVPMTNAVMRDKIRVGKLQLPGGQPQNLLIGYR